MEYRKFGSKIFIRLEPGEEIVESMTALQENEGISLATVTGLGAINELVAGVFDPEKKEYFANEFHGLFEIVSLTGTMTRMDGKPYLHLHLSAGDDKGHVFGGHLNKAVISATAEICVDVVEGNIGRKFSDEIGLNLFSFE